MSRGWDTRDICYACKAVGDMIDDPLYTGQCDECDEECCARCGHVEGDVDGNIHTCRACQKARDAETLPATCTFPGCDGDRDEGSRLCRPCEDQTIL